MRAGLIPHRTPISTIHANPSNLSSLPIRSTSRRRHPETHPPPSSGDPPAAALIHARAGLLGSSAVTARSPTPPSSRGGRQHGRRPHTRGHGRSQSPVACWRLRTSILHLELTGQPRYPFHLLSSPHLPASGVYLNFIFLLLLQNCSVSGLGGGAPRLVLLGGSADQGRREEGGRMNAYVRRCSWVSSGRPRQRTRAGGGGDLEKHA
jgi:hypothetical protein